MIQIINDAKNLDRAVLIHVRTQKGRGYDPAVRHPELYHGVAPFNRETGRPLTGKGHKTYTDVFSDVLCRLGESSPKVVAITAAMADGTGMSAFSKRFPNRFYDVGIAEEHAVTFAAGMAAAGYHPVVAVYSSFLQRAYDQILHDVCLQNLPVTFAIDRAGLVGDDGETHQGVFDISYLRMMPNMVLLAPKNGQELELDMEFAVNYPGPVAIRYPKTAACTGRKECLEPIRLGKCEVLEHGGEIAILAYGSMVEIGENALKQLKANGFSPTFVNLRFAKPLDYECIDRLLASHRLVVVLEENVRLGSIGEEIGAYAATKCHETKVLGLGLPDRFIPHGSIPQLLAEYGLDAAGVVKKVLAAYNEIGGKA